jgi:uncharacterized protein YjbI with pentapeptide repeats
MANEEHLAILRQGVDVWNAWRSENPDVTPDLWRANLSLTSLRGVNLSWANLGGANLGGANLGGANLSWAEMSGVNLGGADLREVNLGQANLGQAKLSQANLGQANLEQAKLSGTKLREANLREAKLSAAILRGVDLRQAKLSQADLSEADLSEANLSEANLSEANLSEANLSRANLSRANLSRTNLRGTFLDSTIFADINLSNVQGLETATHSGPSHISTDTLIKSNGKLPEPFLRGCGVPDGFIEYLPALIGAMQPIQFYSCFISYSTKDEEFAKRLHSKMRDNKLRVWFANEDLKGGHKLQEQIDEAIRVYDKFIIVLSPESLRSKWVMGEVRRTRKAELANNQRKFFPIAVTDYRKIEAWECIDPETGTDLAAEIREYYIPDFRGWKNHDKFEKAFAQLLEGLKAVDAPPAPRVEPKGNLLPDPSESKKRRLRILEDQQARMGVLTPPHVIMEIEDLRREISKLESKGYHCCQKHFVYAGITSHSTCLSHIFHTS